METAKKEVFIRFLAIGDYKIDWGGEGNQERIGPINPSYLFTYNEERSHHITIYGYIFDLGVGRNELTSLDVSNMPQLRLFSCFYNNLTSLDISKNKNLIWLSISNNQISTLDITNNTKLSFVDSNNNKLTCIKIGNLNELTWITFSNNQLTSIDLSNLPMLSRVEGFSNNLSGLNLTGSSSLDYLGIRNNQLVSLDLSTNTVLRSVDVLNNDFSYYELDNLYRSLHDNDISIWSKSIVVFGNPGAAQSDISIAEDKGWEVVWENPFENELGAWVQIENDFTND